jgi:4'-phosphopantetheinyl transferase
MTAGVPVLLAWARLDEVSPDDAWLGPWESAHAATLRFPKRRDDWRLGRWAAKRAVAAALHRDDPASVEVRTAGDGAPEVLLDGRHAPMSISLSHRDGVAAAVVAGKAVRIGVDLEVVEPRTDAFVRDYLTEGERSFVLEDPGERDLRTALVWATKEAALKLTRTGLRVDTRSVEARPALDPGPGGWSRTTATTDGQAFRGRWARREDVVVVVVGDPAIGVPVLVPSRVVGVP